jgi:hypothetical protein
MNEHIIDFYEYNPDYAATDICDLDELEDCYRGWSIETKQAFYLGIKRIVRKAQLYAYEKGKKEEQAACLDIIMTNAKGWPSVGEARACCDRIVDFINEQEKA